MNEVDTQMPSFVDRNLLLHCALGLLSLGTRIAAASARPTREAPLDSAGATHYALLGLLAFSLHLEDRLDLHVPKVERGETTPPIPIGIRLLR